MSRGSLSLLLGLLGVLPGACPHRPPPGPSPLRFEVVLPAGLAEKPVTGRLVLLLSGDPSAEPRFHSVGGGMHFSGMHFLSMARKHESLIRDYVRERRDRWRRLFSPRPIYVSRFGCRFS